MQIPEKIAKLHEPVLLDEVLEAFGLSGKVHLKKGARVIDATLGLGGHTEALVKKGIDVLGIEGDFEMLKLAEERLKTACPTPKIGSSWGSFKLVHGNFRKIDEIAREEGFLNVFGILFDLGVSSPQITSPERGFSFQNDSAPLDMRIDPKGQSVKGSDLLNLLREDQLINLFEQVLSVRDSRILAKEIIYERTFKKIENVGDFKKIIGKSIFSKGKLNISTRPFLALRIAVNSEIENITQSLPKAFGLLGEGGRVVVISFHSGEDAEVKSFFKNLSSRNLGRIIAKWPITPGEEEIKNNIRSRSAKMRILEKI